MQASPLPAPPRPLSARFCCNVGCPVVQHVVLWCKMLCCGATCCAASRNGRSIRISRPTATQPHRSHAPASLKAYRLGLPHPHRHRDRPTAATSGPGPGPPLPTSAPPAHICTWTGSTAATSAPGLRPLLPHRQWDWAHSCGLTAQAKIDALSEQLRSARQRHGWTLRSAPRSCAQLRHPVAIAHTSAGGRFAGRRLAVPDGTLERLCSTPGLGRSYERRTPVLAVVRSFRHSHLQLTGIPLRSRTAHAVGALLGTADRDVVLVCLLALLLLLLCQQPLPQSREEALRPAARAAVGDLLPPRAACMQGLHGRCTVSRHGMGYW